LKNKVIEIVSTKLKNKNIILEEDVNFISIGYIDSLDFIDIISLIEEEFDIEMDFLEIDPSELTTVNGLVKYLESQL
jgi:acyl carrier protein